MDSNTITVGVLCIQGAFIEHIHKLTTLSSTDKHRDLTITIVEVREPGQLSDLDGLIIPGGESTTLSVFLRKNEFEQTLKAWISDKQRPGVVWGTCAGLIILADDVVGQKLGGQVTIGGLNIQCTRNMYGRQNKSFESAIKLHHPPLHAAQPTSAPPPFPLADDECHGIFIRAPGILKVNSPDVKVLASVNDDNIVAVQQDHLIATSFHPELTSDFRWHSYFVDQIKQHRYPQY
uniref:glutaminase n=1 Tax=Suberites domuncula TaxID=55567 RepID=Q8WPW0_SUBDO|nr:SNO protein [Suberites domuncula]